MNFRQLQESDIAYMAEHGIREDGHKVRIDNTEYNYTLEHDGAILGIAGFRFITDTTAWCWLQMGEEAMKHLTISFRTLSEWIGGYTGINGERVPGFCETNGIRRLEAYVEVGFEAGIRLVEHLDFHEESRMLNFIDDKPAIRFVRFFKEKT